MMSHCAWQVKEYLNRAEDVKKMIGDQGGSSPHDAPPPSNGPAPAAGTKPKPPGGGGGEVLLNDLYMCTGSPGHVDDAWSQQCISLPAESVGKVLRCRLLGFGGGFCCP